MPNHYCELSYIQLIEDELLKEFDDDYSLYVLHNDLDQIEGYILEEKVKSDTNYKIAIHVGNEVDYNPKYYELFNKVFPINIGFNSSGEYGIYPNKGNKLSERSNDVFFMGNLSPRENFYQSIKKLNGKYKIEITNGFRQGLPIKEYLKELSNTKICLVPNGVSPETFRYTESFGSGCIVIAKDNINTWFYENSPAIFVNDWSEVTEEFINNILLSDIDEMYIKNIDYYEKYLSPKSNADYIIKTIKNKI